MSKLDRFFRGNLIPHTIDGFPYPEKFCRFCERELTLEQAIHLSEPEHFKALYICHNRECGAFDEPAHKAYAYVYYSDTEAWQALELQRIWYSRDDRKVKELEAIERSKYI